MFCPSCNFENPDDAKNCMKCGNVMLQYNSCGMPMIGNSSRGQVLGMRYVIEEQIAEGAAGCIYLSEDLKEKTKVLIKALPLSIPLNSGEITLLKEYVELITSLSLPDINGLRDFGIAGKLRYFVYAYPAQHQYDNTWIIEQAENKAGKKASFDISEKSKLEAELQFYKNNFENQQAEAEKEINILQQEKESALNQITAYKNELEQAHKNYEELTQKFALNIIQSEQYCDQYQKTIENLRMQITAGEQEHTVQLNQFKSEIDRFRSALAEADKKTAFLSEEKDKLSDQNIEFERKIQQLNLAHEQQLRDYVLKLRQAEQSAEKEKSARTRADRQYSDCQKLIEKTKSKNEKSKAKSDSKLKEYEQKLLSETRDRQQAEIKRASCENEIEKLNAQIIAQDHKHTTALNEQNEKIAQLSAALSQAEQKIKSVEEKKNQALQQSLEDKANLNKAKAETSRLQEDYARQLDKAQWKIRALTAEVNKSTEKLKKLKNKPAPKFKNTLALSLVLVFIVVLSLGAGSLYLSKPIFFAVNKGQDKDFLAAEQIQHQKPLEYFSQAAQNENAIATYNMGKIYHHGDGVEADGGKAVQYYEEAAQAGLTQAMNQLAQMYYFGDIVKQDYEKAAQYYKKSAEKDNLDAMYNLALLYQNGVGVEKDIRKTMLWFIKAAKAGDADSMCQLGVLFENGLGIEKDMKKAIYWYQAAAKTGHQTAKQKLIELGIDSKNM